MKFRSKIYIGIIFIVIAVPFLIYFAAPSAALAFVKFFEMRLSGVEQKSVKVGDHSIIFFEGGTGEPILMVHGFGGDRYNWIRFARYLSSGYRVIIPDLPGFGESTRLDDGKYTNMAQVERLKKFADTLGLNKFHIVGCSMGGNISGNFAADHPERIITLALIDSAGVKGPVKSEHELLVEKGFNPLLAHGVNDYDRMIAFSFTSVPFIPYPFKKVMAEIAAGRKVFYGKIYSQINDDRFELQKKLPTITSPTLILWGDRDRIINVANAEVFAKGIKNSRVVIMKECGHLPMIERPEEAARIYMDFLNGKN